MCQDRPLTHTGSKDTEMEKCGPKVTFSWTLTFMDVLLHTVQRACHGQTEGLFMWTLHFLPGSVSKTMHV